MAIQTMQEKIEALRKRSSEAKLGGGVERLEKQRQGGKLTARERVDALVDVGSFDESGLFAEHRATLFGMAGKSFPADGVVTGAASVDGRLIHLASQDFSVSGGSAGEVHSIKVASIMEQSLKTGSPFVFITRSSVTCSPKVPWQKLFFPWMFIASAPPNWGAIVPLTTGGQ